MRAIFMVPLQTVAQRAAPWNLESYKIPFPLAPESTSCKMGDKIHPFYNYEIYNFKKVQIPSPFQGKMSAFYYMKQHLMYFHVLLFKFPSLPDRFSNILDFG